MFFDGDELVGMGAFRNVSAHDAEIERMRVLHEYQGQGIGKMILTKLEESSRKKGYSRLILETSDKQIAANKLYRNYDLWDLNWILLMGIIAHGMKRRLGNAKNPAA